MTFAILRARAAKAAGALLLASGLFGAPLAQAQGGKPPIRILVGFPAGGGVDVVARILAEGMSQSLGQAVVVENRPGAGGLLAAQALKQAAPDGNTLLLSNDHTVAILPQTLKNPGFDVVRDFTPVALVSGTALGLATHADTGITQLKDLAEWARLHPGKASIGVPAPGSIPDFGVGMLARSLKVDASSVTYRGGAPLAADLVAGQIPLGITALPELLPYHKARKIRILAVSGPRRAPWLPEVPTFAELSIKGFELPNLTAFYAPAGTPDAVVRRYNEVLRPLLASDRIREKFEATFSYPSYAGPEELSKTVQSIADTWRPVIKQSGFQPQ